MDAFNIAKLDSEVGILRVSGSWEPLSGEILLQSISQLGMDGWVDTSFWLTEQNFETEVFAVLTATREYLLSVSLI